MSIVLRHIGKLVLLGCLCGQPRPLLSCPFCPVPEPSLSELIEQSDHVLLGRWLGGAEPSAASPKSGEARFSIVDVMRQAAGESRKGSVIVAARPATGTVGNLFLLTGVQTTRVEWKKPVPMSAAAFRYLLELPPRSKPPSDRLSWFLRHLEHPDSIISNDAFSEFAAAPYSDVEPLAREFSAADLRGWIARKETQQTRIGFYGLMLGLCGAPSDAEFLKAEIERPSEIYRLGFDGLLAGYVLLTGDDGISLLEQKLTQQNDRGFTESYAAMQALRFLWQFDRRRTSPQRLRQAMRRAIDRPELSDLAIKDLARWEDWDLLPSLVQYYDAPGENARLKRRAILQYLITLSQKSDGQSDPDLQQKIEFARKHLSDLSSRDPKAVADARRYLF